MAIEPQILAELKEALLKQKTELEENLSRIAKPVDDKGDYKTSFEDIGTDQEDNATEVEQYADNLPVEITLEKKLQSVIEALEKMEKGTYGICAECSEAIEIDRLRANPSARRCIKCKNQAPA
jgi:DnaK suppressor protein